ncbi:NAD(P)H-binding protein [Dactylosporangium sp. NPDC005555]|uniref:NAD(P)-dependent oxidoreductase n=1 Tax=Dactylosporangium sp. NPDC005555 TaxID=3154889 RepID=UPI0033B15E92
MTGSEAELGDEGGGGLQVGAAIGEVADERELEAGAQEQAGDRLQVGVRGDPAEALFGAQVVGEPVVGAVRATGVRRIVSVDAAGRVSDPGDGLLMRTVAKPLVRRILRANFDDLAEAERVLRASDLDWTLISPPRLTDNGHRPYRTVLDHGIRAGRTLSRADVADAMLNSVTTPAHIHHRVSVAY